MYKSTLRDALRDALMLDSFMKAQIPRIMSEDTAFREILCVFHPDDPVDLHDGYITGLRLARGMRGEYLEIEFREMGGDDDNLTFVDVFEPELTRLLWRVETKWRAHHKRLKAKS